MVNRRPLLCLAILALSCANTNYPELYKSATHAPSIDPTEVEALHVLGPTMVDKGVNFGVYAEHATKLQLMVFDTWNSNNPTRTFEMTRFGDVWNVYVQGVGEGQAYGYRAWGPNWTYDDSWFPGSIKGFHSDVDRLGNRYNPNKLLFDPYSKSITRDHDWSLGSSASGPQRTSVDYGGAMKSLVVKSKYKWSANETAYRDLRKDENAVGHRWNDLIIYEVHPKGFTASPASGVDHPGTYRGIAEKVDYFAQLGVTAVQLMPVFEKPDDGGYWGYQTLNFFSPEITYSSKRGAGEPMDEFKALVDEFHKRNIEVLLDVVYNHTGEGGLWRQKIQTGGSTLDPGASQDPRTYANLDPKEVAGLYAYRGLDNQAYYALSPDNQYYSDNTGVGNEMRANYLPFRRMILDSLRYWVTEMHVDGFRFDLATVLGEPDKDYGCFAPYNAPNNALVVNTALQEIIDDPTLQSFNTRIIAEPWGLNCYAVGCFPASRTQPGNGWYEHNGPFRDWWRAFVNGIPYNGGAWTLGAKNGPADAGFTLFGSKDLFYDPTSAFIARQRNPYNSVNFVTVHDGFTMYDLFSYDKKQNGCGPLSPDCCSPVTPLCNNDGEDYNRSKDWAKDAEFSDFNVYLSRYPASDANRYAEAGAAQSHDIEARKRQMMRNLYLALMVSRGTPMLLGGDEWERTQLGNNNAYTTRSDNEYNWFDWGAWQARDEAQRMHDFVSKMTQFRKDHAYAFAPMGYDSAAPLEWRGVNGTTTGVNWDGRALQVLESLDGVRGKPVLILINMEPTETAFTLPPGTWKRLVDTQSFFEEPTYLSQQGLTNQQSGNVTLGNPATVSGAYTTKKLTMAVFERQ